jgi:phosphatidylglycerol lysyltransferase
VAWRTARDLVLCYGCNATAYQILNPGMTFWFPPDGQAVVGYVASAGFRVVAGSPICPTERLASVVAAFEADARRSRQRVCYFGVQERLTRVLAMDGPLACLRLGAQPVWSPQHWPAVVSRKSSLRAQLARARNKRVVVTRWTTELASSHHLALLARCLREWLQTRHLPPMHFLVEPETLAYLDGRRVYVAQREGQLVGFLVASPVPLRNGWFVEQMVRGAHAPNGTTDLLLDTAIRDMAASGAAYVTLGLSPLSRRANLPPYPHPPWLGLVLSWIRAYGQRFYNFDGLDAFKARFLPETWEPVYAVMRGPRVSWRMLYAIAGAFSGTSPLWFIGQGVGKVVRQQVQRMVRA